MRYPSELTWVEISRSALLSNVSAVASVIGRAKLFPVVKSNAYGHGFDQVVRILDTSKHVAGYMVVSLDEALALRSFTDTRCIVMSMWQRDSRIVAKALHRRIELPIFDMESALFLSRCARKNNRLARVHLKVDVGTSRIGFSYTDHEALRKITSLKGIRVEGIFSHFADSENSDERFTISQEKRFMAAAAYLTSYLGRPVMQHIACSAAALRGTRYAHDAVRLGIATYGLWPSSDTPSFSLVDSLKPVLSWKTTVLQVKKVPKNTTIGYGMTYRCPRATMIATLPVGYWDGYDRRFSNSGMVGVNGRVCPVRGRVCMNLTMVEVPLGVKVRAGDEAVLIGPVGSRMISADDLARWAGTINYEIVTRINPLAPRRSV